MKKSMKTTARLLMAAIFVSVSMAMNAQSENPRGIYKLMSIKGKMELNPYPYDIYKIITDSVTMRFMMSDRDKRMFRIDMPDFKPFNYTGKKEITDETDTEQQIYDSDSKRFTQKWWSRGQTSPIFPENDWCYEFYESGQYSADAKPIFEALTFVPSYDPNNPLIGIWQHTITMDQLMNIDNWKDILNHLRKEGSANGENGREFHAYTSTHTVAIPLPKWRPMVDGYSYKIRYNSKDTITLGENRTRQIHWLTDDAFAIKVKVGDTEKYHIFERVKDGQTLLGYIASKFLSDGYSLN